MACVASALGAGQTKGLQRPLATFFYPSVYWQGLGKHLVDNAASVSILRCSKNRVYSRDKKFRQGAPHGMCGQCLRRLLARKRNFTLHVIVTLKRQPD